MITEEQRRALFALREALHLCAAEGMTVSEAIGGVAVYGPGCSSLIYSENDLTVTAVEDFLAEHPET